MNTKFINRQVEKDALPGISALTWLSAFLKSFTYAVGGFVVFFRYERNGKIQLLAAIVAVILAWQLHVSLHEWMCVVGCIAAVLSFEMINSAIERLCNLVEPQYHPAVKCIKDIAAAAVLGVSLCSLFMGVMIFLPKIFTSLKI